MSTTTNLPSMTFNKMSSSKYSSITPVEGQFYVTPDDNVVHTTGNETINGVKTFKATNVFNTSYTNYKATTMDIANSPTTYDTVGLQFVDKLGYVGGQDILRSESDGRIMNWCYVHNHANTAWTGNGVGFDSNDNAVAYITSKLVKGFVTSTYKSGTNWYRIWSDGWIEQGGLMSSGTTATVTLHKPFVDTNYSILTTEFTNGSTDTEGVDYVTMIRSKTTTSFSCSTASGRTNHWYAYGY